MRATEKDITLLIEDSNTKLKELIRTNIFNLITIEITKQEALKIINDCYKSIKQYEGYDELAEQTRLALLESFSNWYTSAIAKISALANINLFAKNVKTVLESSKNQKVKSFVFSGNNLETKDLPTTELRNYMLSGKTGYSQMLIDNYTKDVNSAMIEISNTSVTLTDKLGRNMSLRNLAEMTVRYNQRNEILSDLKGSGVNLVMISQHTNASKRCAPWQGRVYSLDGSSGFTHDKNHYKYVPLEEATKNHQLFGYNCRHRAFEYKLGMDRPKPIPSEQIKRERELEQTQRVMELEIRNAKIKQSISGERTKWQKISVKAQETYRNFCTKNKLVYEEWRTRITMTEREKRNI